MLVAVESVFCTGLGWARGRGDLVTLLLVDLGVRVGVRETERAGVLFCCWSMLSLRVRDTDLRGVLSIDLFGVLSLALVGVFCLILAFGDFSREFCAARFFLKAVPKFDR